MSRKICELYLSCCGGSEESVRTFLSTQPLPPNLPPPRTAEERESEKMEEEEEEGEELGVVMEAEGGEGGWEVVRKPRRRSKK